MPILHADDGLEDELSQKVRSALNAVSIGAGLADYWAERIDETASDLMGILNMGPAAGIGLGMAADVAADSGRSVTGNKSRFPRVRPRRIGRDRRWRGRRPIVDG